MCFYKNVVWIYMDTTYLSETAGGAISSANDYLTNVFSSEYTKYFMIFVIVITLLVIGYIVYRIYSRESFEVFVNYEGRESDKNNG